MEFSVSGIYGPVQGHENWITLEIKLFIFIITYGVYDFHSSQVFSYGILKSGSTENVPNISNLKNIISFFICAFIRQKGVGSENFYKTFMS